MGKEEFCYYTQYIRIPEYLVLTEIGQINRCHVSDYNHSKTQTYIYGNRKKKREKYYMGYNYRIGKENKKILPI
jgi:hypothetical protein